MSAKNWFNAYNSKDPLEQGVILTDFDYIDVKSVPYPYADEGEEDFVYENGDMIVLTQTCDLAQKKVDRVHLCPVFTLDDYFLANPNLASNKGQVKSEYRILKSGQRVDVFLINACNMKTVQRLCGKTMVALFGSSIVVSTEYVEQFLQKSKRKNFLSVSSPYRESLSQAYARYFMRVANPIDHSDVDPKFFVASSDA